MDSSRLASRITRRPWKQALVGASFVIGIFIVAQLLLAAKSVAARLAQLRPALSLYLDTTAPWPKFQGNSQNSGLGVASGANGLEKWTFQTGEVITSPPIVGSDGTIYFGSNDGTFYAINADGTYKWSLAADVPNAALLGPGVIYVAALDKVYALNPATGQIKWSYPFSSSEAAGLAIGPEGLLYVVSSNQYLYAFDSKKGLPEWSFSIESYVGPPAVDPVTGTIYVNAPNGGSQRLVASRVGPKRQLGWESLPGADRYDLHEHKRRILDKVIDGGPR